jgi:hypothetical protein
MLGLQTRLDNAKASSRKIEQRAEAILSHTPQISVHDSTSLLRVIGPPKAAGYDAADFIAAGCRWTELKTAGFTAAEAKAAGCDDVPVGAAAAETSCGISAQRLYLQAAAYSPEKDLHDWGIFKDLHDKKEFAKKIDEVLKDGARRDKLKNFALYNTMQNPERLSSLSNFNYLCVHCISEFLLRYPDAVDAPTMRKRSLSFDRVKEFDTHDVQDVDAMQDIPLVHDIKDILHLQDNTPVADPDTEKCNLELLEELGKYLEELNLLVSNLENMYPRDLYAFRHVFGSLQTHLSAELQSLLVHKRLRPASSHKSGQDCAFHVLERTILNSKYFIEQNKIIMELVEELNGDISNKTLRETLDEKFKDLCTAVASEQLHFVFDFLEITHPVWNDDESPANSIYFIPEAEDPPSQFKHRQKPSAPRAGGGVGNISGGDDRPNSGQLSASIQPPLFHSQWAVTTGEATKQDKIISPVRDDTYIWLDLQGDVLMEALRYEKRDVKSRAKGLIYRRSIFERLCKQACAVFVFF